MTMSGRVVAAETLDSLSEHDPAALESRRDLQRIHRLMGTRGIVLKALRGMTGLQPGDTPFRILEIGAGDGSLMLGVAGQLKQDWPAVRLTLMDRQALVSTQTLAAYDDVGWVATTRVTDVLDWSGDGDVAADQSAEPAWDLVVANLFLHHFEGPPLALLMQAIAARSRCFLACEPRRSRLALVGSHLVGAIGANAVTREDAVLSVQAGFTDRELSALWLENAPTQFGWTLREYAAGLFSHCFVAERVVVQGKGPP